ncbi:hypothetical protein ACFL0R_03610 [Pseudomonadota bacterium]
MNKTITFLRNGWTALLLISLGCFAITSTGVGPTWATWNLGLYATMALMAVSTIASIGYITWASTRSIFATSNKQVVEMPTRAQTSTTANLSSVRKAA